MSIRVACLIAFALLLGSGCSNTRSERRFSKGLPAGSARRETGVDVSIVRVSPETVRLVSVLRRRNSSETREEFDILTLPEIVCRVGESAEYRLEGVPGKNEMRFVPGKLPSDEDGVGVSVKCEETGEKLKVMYSAEFREHHKGSGTSQRVDGTQTF